MSKLNDKFTDKDIELAYSALKKLEFDEVKALCSLAFYFTLNADKADEKCVLDAFDRLADKE